MLDRKPAVVLVDDLGLHAGAIGALRYAGMDVISTADVADVQRVAAAVQEITGRAPTASVSDEMLADADEVQFVDSSPEALRKRLGHGNIYPPDQVSAALASEFQTPRLAALRELGLRLIADTLPAPAAPGPASRRTSWWSSATRTAPRRSRRTGSGWPGAAARAARCCCSARRRGGRRPRPRIRQSATAADAREIERAGDAATVIPQSVRETGARHLVLAAAPAGLLDRLRGSAVERLLVQLPDVDLHVLTGAPGGRPPGTPGGGGHDRG